MAIEWHVFDSLQDYSEIQQLMACLHNRTLTNPHNEAVLLLEHQPIITGGASAKEKDLLSPTVPVLRTNRGGQFTYHGPGQVICYPVLNLILHDLDARSYVRLLEDVILQVLRDFGISGFLNERVGVWVLENGHEKKIAAIGVRISKHISTHGFSINVSPDLKHFSEIVPCGITEYGVTSFEKLGIFPDAHNVMKSIKHHLSYQLA